MPILLVSRALFFLFTLFQLVWAPLVSALGKEGKGYRWATMPTER